MLCNKLDVVIVAYTLRNLKCIHLYNRLDFVVVAYTLEEFEMYACYAMS